MRKVLSCAMALWMVFLCACGGPEGSAGYSGRVIDTRKFAARSDYDAYPDELPRGIRAVIVPHHTPALRMAARVLAGLGGAPPPTVILLAPNHTSRGPKIATARAAFSAHDGLVLPREDLLHALERGQLAGFSEALFEEEHSVGAVMPLIARYLPGAKVVPLLFQKGASLKGAMEAIQALRPLDPGTLVIASIDFSHGLPAREEPARRAAMLGYIQAFDARAILGLDATYLDAPVVLAALLRLLEENGITGLEVASSANTAELTGSTGGQVTGYMTVVFYG